MGDLPTRDEFIAAYAPRAGVTAESAGKVYDLLTDDSPEAAATLREGMLGVFENVLRQSAVRIPDPAVDDGGGR